MDPDILEWVKTLLTFVGPILVVIVTARLEHNRKTDNRVKQLEDEKRATANTELQNTIKSINDRINTLDQTIKLMQESSKETKNEVQSVVRTCNITSKYMHELAELVTILAEGMRDQHLDGNITRAISSYRNFEHDTLAHLMSANPVDK